MINFRARGVVLMETAVIAASIAAAVAFVGVVVNAVVTLRSNSKTASVTLENIRLTNDYNRKYLTWQQEQWLKKNKRELFSKSLELLSVSILLSFDKSGVPVEESEAENVKFLYVEDDRFHSIMDSLKWVPPLLPIVSGYCSDAGNAARINTVFRDLKASINKTLAQKPFKIKKYKKPVRLDRGLSRAVRKALEVLMEVSSVELLTGDLPTLPSATKGAQQ
jgi:hypothetical protein